MDMEFILKEVYIIGIVCVCVCSCSMEECDVSNITTNVIPMGYRPMRHPPLHEGPIKVELSMLITDIFSIDEGNQKIHFQMFFRLRWKDIRLQPPSDLCGLNYVSVDGSFLDLIWKPDIVFDRLSSINLIPSIVPIMFVRIFNDSSLFVSLPFNVILSCKMYFAFHPLDTQYCVFQIYPFGYDAKTNMVAFTEQVSLSPRIKMAGFNVSLEVIKTFNITYEDGSTYSSVATIFIFSRHLSQYLLTVYLPGFIFLLLAWLSLLVPAEHVPGRMALVVTNLLAATDYISFARPAGASLTYLTASDVWLHGCQSVSLISLIEYTLVMHLSEQGSRMVDMFFFKVYPAICTPLIIIYWLYLFFANKEPDYLSQLDE